MAVTVKDLARMTNFSTSTISRVLTNRGYVDAATRKIVEQAVKESGYVYHPVSTKRGGTKMVMLVMGEIANEVYAQSIKGISSIFDAQGVMYVGTYAELLDTEKLEFYMRWAISNRFEGLILFSPIETPSFIRMMRNCSIPCVAMNKPMNVVDMDQVCMDNKLAGKLAVEYLARRGHKHIAFVSTNTGSSGEYRRRGYLAGMEEMGLEVRSGDVLIMEHTFESGVSAGSIIAATMPDITAVYTSNILIARGVIEGLCRCGKRVPEDVSIVATDNISEAWRSRPTLTTVSCNFYRMGVEAALLFLERSKDPFGKKRQIFLPPEIIERDSVVSLETY